MIEREICNCQELIRLWKEAPVEWMIISGTEETPFIHGENFSKLLEKKLALMEKYKNDEPFIDPDYMFRIADNPFRHGAIGNPIFAFFIEAIAFVIFISIINKKIIQKPAGQALLGSMAAVLAVNLFPLVKYAKLCSSSHN